jgi:hypothetical protein
MSPPPGRDLRQGILRSPTVYCSRRSSEEAILFSNHQSLLTVQFWLRLCCAVIFVVLTFKIARFREDS